MTEILLVLNIVFVLGVLAFIGHKIRGRFRHLDDQLNSLGTRVLDRLEEKALEIQNAISVGQLGFQFPVFFGDYSIDSFHARFIVQELVARPPRTVLELGSGSSTAVIARALRLLGTKDVKHISVDHDSNYLNRVKRYLELSGISDLVALRLCPLAPIDVGELDWYKGVPELLEGRKIDLLIVDGPHASPSTVRYAALPVLYDHLSPQCTIVLDDANRQGEQEIVARWMKEYPEFTCTRYQSGHGLAVLMR